MLALGLLGCGAEEEPATAGATRGEVGCYTDADGAYPTWTSWGQPFFRSWCASCHAASTPQRFGAPEALTFDDEAEVKAQIELIRQSVLVAATMPQGGGLSDEERAELERFLSCLNGPP